MSVDLIILIAAIFVAWLVFTWLVKVVKASISTAITIAVIVLILQLVFGIGPQELWQQILDLPQMLFDRETPENSNDLVKGEFLLFTDFLFFSTNIFRFL